MVTIRRRNTFANDIAEELRKRIGAGEIQPGEFLESQKTLADQFGVSLSTIREAIQALAAVGLVESYPGKGTWVRQEALSTVFNSTAVKTRLGELNAREVYEARSVVEVGLTRFAAERATEEDIRKVWRAIHEMEDAAGDTVAFVKADLDFHLAVARAGHNHLLEQFYYLVRELLSEVITEMVLLPNVREESIVLQRAIADAIEAHNPKYAQDAAGDHMHYIENLIERYG